MKTLELMVCPHDTAGDPLKWFQFAHYLTVYGKLSSKHYKCLDFTEFHELMPRADVVYANPQDSLILLEKHKYIPLVHSTNLFDEIVFIGNNDVKNGSPIELDLQDCVSCNGMMVTRIGLKYLLEQSIKPKKVHSRDNWMAVMRAVSKGDLPYGFLYKDFYDGLNNLSKSKVTKMGETTERSIFHSVLIKQELSTKAELITKILMDAHNTEKGKEVLKSVNIDKFIPVTSKEILNFKSLLLLGSEFLS